MYYREEAVIGGTYEKADTCDPGLPSTVEVETTKHSGRVFSIASRSLSRSSVKRGIHVREHSPLPCRMTYGYRCTAISNPPRLVVVGGEDEDEDCPGADREKNKYMYILDVNKDVWLRVKQKFYMGKKIPDSLAEAYLFSVRSHVFLCMELRLYFATIPSDLSGLSRVKGSSHSSQSNKWVTWTLLPNAGVSKIPEVIWESNAFITHEDSLISFDSNQEIIQQLKLVFDESNRPSHYFVHRHSPNFLRPYPSNLAAQSQAVAATDPNGHPYMYVFDHEGACHNKREYAWRYSLRTLQWERVGCKWMEAPWPNGRANLEKSRIGFSESDNTLFVIGGGNETARPSEIFRPCVATIQLFQNDNVDTNSYANGDGKNVNRSKAPGSELELGARMGGRWSLEICETLLRCVRRILLGNSKLRTQILKDIT
eukprot:178532-Amorphochlora_amoeboformis.AAC.1